MPLTAAIRPLDHLVLRGANDAPALLLRDAVLSYQDLRTRVARLSGWLTRIVNAGGVNTPGARIASWAAKGELTCLLPLAAARAGLVHVPINPLLKRAQVAHILADSGASQLIGTPARLDTLVAGDVPAGCAVWGEAAALAAACDAGADLPPSAADPAALAAILYTSGSTGRPQGRDAEPRQYVAGGAQRRRLSRADA